MKKQLHPDYFREARYIPSDEGQALFNLYSKFQPNFSDESRMKAITHVMNNKNLSYGRRLEKIKTHTTGYTMNEYERKYVKKLLQQSYDSHLGEKNKERTFKDKINSLFLDYVSDFGQHSTLMKEIASIASNRGYSHQKRLEKIDSILLDPIRHYNPLNDAEREFMRKLYALEFNHIKTSAQKGYEIRNFTKVGIKVMQTKRDFEDYSPPQERYIPPVTLSDPKRMDEEAPSVNIENKLMTDPGPSFLAGDSTNVIISLRDLNKIIMQPKGSSPLERLLYVKPDKKQEDPNIIDLNKSRPNYSFQWPKWKAVAAAGISVLATGISLMVAQMRRYS